MKTLQGLALAAATFCCAAAASAQPPDDLLLDLTRRAAVYREVFDRLSSPEVSEAVLEALATRKPDVFEALGDGLDVPDELRCPWVRGAVQTWLRTPHATRKTCFLRNDLSYEEYVLYRQIRLQYYQAVVQEDASLQLTGLMPMTLDPMGLGPRPTAVYLPPGPFLDALRKAGLVSCRYMFTVDTSILAPLTQVLDDYCSG
ncbi:MAG: hypothetical protein ABW221_26975 [Vicinamibacteria bacterium]